HPAAAAGGCPGPAGRGGRGRSVPRTPGRTGRHPGAGRLAGARPQRGHDVFARGAPEIFGNTVDAGQAVDVVEFLWASLALFDDDTAVDTTEIYRARPFELYQVAEARARILRLLADAPEGAPLERFVPDPAGDPDGERRGKIRLRSGWASTLIAGLELAKQGEVVLGQGGDFEPIHVAPA
ncbi:MAG: segregation and condensation protein, partial [Acetobacteraceae bacterium]|nr:segregation and condensation protein [Acetobacteraceae bacterium]